MANQIKLTFGNGTEGTLHNNDHELAVSYTGKGFAPYELFLGGFSACLHATFASIMFKRKLAFENVEYNVVGHKREEVPTVLNKLETNIIITGVEESKQAKVLKTMEQAEKYCSISHTIANLDAEMIFNIEFK
jgi:putative redox protein